jgi:hypothetical protein
MPFFDVKENSNGEKNCYLLKMNKLQNIQRDVFLIFIRFSSFPTSDTGKRMLRG